MRRRLSEQAEYVREETAWSDAHERGENDDLGPIRVYRGEKLIATSVDEWLEHDSNETQKGVR